MMKVRYFIVESISLYSLREYSGDRSGIGIFEENIKTRNLTVEWVNERSPIFLIEGLLQSC